MINIKTRYIPSDYKQYSPELGDYPKDMFACWVNLDNPDKPRAMFFIGKQSQPSWSYYFKDIDSMKNQINESIKRVMYHEEQKQKRKTEKAERVKNMDTSVIKIGDIYHWSGGYNCTRNDYIKITGTAGKNKFKAVKLSKTQVSGDWMNGEVAPVIDSNCGDIIVKAMPSHFNDNEIILKDTSSKYKEYYHKWNGKPNWENCD